MATAGIRSYLSCLSTSAVKRLGYITTRTTVTNQFNRCSEPLPRIDRQSYIGAFIPFFLVIFSRYHTLSSHLLHEFLIHYKFKHNTIHFDLLIYLFNTTDLKSLEHNDFKRKHPGTAYSIQHTTNFRV